MSLKNTKNLLIIAAVLVAVLTGTVLLGNYTNILSAGSDSSQQVKASGCCPAAKGCSAVESKAACTQKANLDVVAKVNSVEKAELVSAAKTCPLDSTKPCCAQEAAKECPADCTKPCCAD